MPVDLEYLREHYSSISDKELLTVNRADLVEEARKCIDEEFQRRQLTPGEGGPDCGPDPVVEKPDWLEDAMGVFAARVGPGQVPGPEIANARDVLEAAGIPCFLDSSEVPEGGGGCRDEMYQWSVMVPGNLNLHASSILERDIFNEDFEGTWKAHLESFSDEEVLAMSPQVVFCGLFDRVERVTRTYAEEIARRGLKSA